MEALRNALLTGMAHLSRILTAFILVKLIAYYYGPAGLGAAGHTMTFMTFLTVFAAGGINNGVIKYSAEYAQSPIRLNRFFYLVNDYAIFSGLIIFIAIAIASVYLSDFIFGSISFYWLIIVVSISQFFIGFTNIVNGFSSGLGKNGILSRIQAIGSLIALPTCWLLLRGQTFVGMILAIIAVSISSAIPAYYFYKKSFFKIRLPSWPPDWRKFKKLTPYTLMLLVSAFAFPVTEMWIRQSLIESSGYQQAGLWQGSIKISSAYIGFFGTFLSFYFMPRLSSTADKLVIARLTFKMAAILMTTFSIGATLFYLYRDQLILIALSSKFSDLGNVIIYQLAGDFFKIGAYVIGFVAVAKAAVRLYIIAEIFQNAIFIALSYVLTNGSLFLSGIMRAYSYTYAIYFILAIIAFLFYLKKAE